MAGMRRSEVSALRWADVVDSTDGDGILVTVRRSKTNLEGDLNDASLYGAPAQRVEVERACSRSAATPPWYMCRSGAKRWLSAGDVDVARPDGERPRQDAARAWRLGGSGAVM